MAMGYAQKQQTAIPSTDVLDQRSQSLGPLRYYTPEVHHGAFGLPQYVQALMTDSKMA
jgi:Spermidine synthase